MGNNILHMISNTDNELNTPHSDLVFVGKQQQHSAQAPSHSTYQTLPAEHKSPVSQQKRNSMNRGPSQNQARGKSSKSKQANSNQKVFLEGQASV